VDQDVAQTAHSTDEQARIGLFRQAEQAVVKDAPWIFLYHTVTVDIRQPNVYFYIHPIHIWRFSDYWIK
jgi:ABC-type transport system substrate-binding protein